jgi:hypothetical protein
MLLLVFVVVVASERPVCKDFQNCWACSNSPLCGWCGSSGRCQLLSNNSACPFTLWKGTCCRTLTAAGCGACIREAGCGWCLQQGCAEGDENGPSSSACDSWYFEKCYEPGMEVIFSGSTVVLGLTSTIGGGLVFACVSVLVYFLVRALLRWKASKEFSKFLKAHSNSCSVCGDIVASAQCVECEAMLCGGCGELECLKSINGEHRLRSMIVSPDDTRPDKNTNWHYESFAHIRAHRSINFDDMD